MFLFNMTNDAAFAKKTNRPAYEEPFDQASGGTSLTRASQEGIMFANPALLPYGSSYLRWVGSQTAVLASPDSIDMVKSLATGSSNDNEEGGAPDVIDRVFTTPIHFGAKNTFSIVSQNFGFGAFAHFEPDIKGEKHNHNGDPSIRARAESYSGAITSFASRPLPWISWGLSLKYLYKTEPDISLSLIDTELVTELQENPQFLKDQVTPGAGFGYDAGVLFISQNPNADASLALKVDDIGRTTFTEAQDDFKQTVHAGLGISFHNQIDVIHLAVDYRDIFGAYEEPVWMRLYTGARVMLRNHIGFAGGYYQGYPSYGVRLDLFLLKIGFTAYTREMGEYPGHDGRKIYVAYFGLGI